MNNNLTPEQIQNLQRQVEEQNQELEALRQQHVVVQPTTQDNFIQSLIDKAGPYVMEYMKMNADTQQHEMEKSIELEKEELKMIDKLDTKEKWYKGLLLTICLAALLLAVFFIDKAEMIIPVLSLIIGLLFKSNTLSDYFSHAKRKINNNDEE